MMIVSKGRRSFQSVRLLALVCLCFLITAACFAQRADSNNDLSNSKIALSATTTGRGSIEVNAEKKPETYDILIKGGRVIDGSGNPWFFADVGIRDSRIVAVGALKDGQAKKVIDAAGKFVAPGFIDMHSHADDGEQLLQKGGLRSDDPKRRAAPNLVSQGITTVVVGQDGYSPRSIAAQIKELNEKKFALNAVLLIGHHTIRALTMASDPQKADDPEEIKKMHRQVTAEELAKMRAMVRQAMAEGAYGLSSGLEYLPGRWSNTAELVALVREIVPFGGVYICHERSSGSDPMWYFPSFGDQKQPTFLDNVVELIEIGEQTGAKVVATHIKARGAHFWGSAHAAIQMMQRARNRGVQIWADQYPYNTTGSDGDMRLIPQWVTGEKISSFIATSGHDKINYAEIVRNILKDTATAQRLRKDIAHEISRRGSAENIVVMAYPDSAYIGKTLYELSQELHLSTVEVGIKLQLEGDPERRGGARLRGYSLSEKDVEAYLSQPWMATSSDARVAVPGDARPVHARYFGAFPRKIREYVLERGVTTLENAIRSMTSLPAQILGFRNRGMIREGFFADVVVFDPQTICDKATFVQPYQYSEGIDFVFVNGQPVVENGRLTWALPGKVITPENSRIPPQTK